MTDADRQLIIDVALSSLETEIHEYKAPKADVQPLIDALVRFGATREDFAFHGLDQEWPTEGRL